MLFRSLGDMPLIGPLLSSNKTEKSKTELMLAVTPRVVRGVAVPVRSLAAFVSGREDDPSLKPPYSAFDPDTDQSKIVERPEMKSLPAGGGSRPVGVQTLPASSVPVSAVPAKGATGQSLPRDVSPLAEKKVAPKAGELSPSSVSSAHIEP